MCAFPIYNEMIMCNVEYHLGIKKRHNVNNLRYADENVSLAEHKEDLPQLYEIVEEESRKKGLELNSKKAEVMVVSQNRSAHRSSLSTQKKFRERIYLNAYVF